MNNIASACIDEIKILLDEIVDGGKVSASIYETAQVLRLQPGHRHQPDVIQWLLQQQQTDGGWGDANYPLYRDVPTLAAVLALYTANGSALCSAAINAGIAFLKQQRPVWAGALADDIPIGIELILPRLCLDAVAIGLDVPLSQYDKLKGLGDKKVARLRASMPLALGSPALHAWEAWGEQHIESIVDSRGSIALSPAATAAWLKMAHRANYDDPLFLKAQQYLERASAATDGGLPGVMPNFWPLGTFEHAWAIYTLTIGNLLTHPSLREYVGTMISTLCAHITAEGIGVDLTVGILPDGDDTAMAVTSLRMAGHQADSRLVRRFQQKDHFLTYIGERNPALTTTIHAVHALQLCGASDMAAEHYIQQQRSNQGLWKNDKWHVSWLYTTSHAVSALAHTLNQEDRMLIHSGIIAQQNDDGGWGKNNLSNFEETAYAVLALYTLSTRENAPREAPDSICQAYQWMMRNNCPFSLPTTTLWIDKELYCPVHLIRIVELTGLYVAHCWVHD